MGVPGKNQSFLCLVKQRKTEATEGKQIPKIQTIIHHSRAHQKFSHLLRQIFSSPTRVVLFPSCPTSSPQLLVCHRERRGFQEHFGSSPLIHPIIRRRQEMQRRRGWQRVVEVEGEGESVGEEVVVERVSDGGREERDIFLCHGRHKADVM
jgi:hypothetical protein